MPDVLISNWFYLVTAAGTTIYLSAGSIALSTALGLGAALLKVFGGAALRFTVEVYIYIIRGVPLLILLFTMYFVLPYSGVDLPPRLGGVLVIGLYFGAFMTEVFRAAIIALPRGQWDAARSLGMRRPLLLSMIILPQALRLAAPSFVNTCMMLVKATSIVSFIGVWELTLAGREVVERTLAPFQIFGGVAFIYFCICFSLAQYARRLEQRLAHGQ